MFYKLLGLAVWKLASAYLRQRFGRYAKPAAIAGVVGVALAGYLATRSGE